MGVSTHRLISPSSLTPASLSWVVHPSVRRAGLNSSGNGLPQRSKSPLSPFGKTERFTMFKVGPIISASHGIGMPSMRVLLHEMAKLMRYAGAHDVIFIRVGTSGGIGSDPGTII